MSDTEVTLVCGYCYKHKKFREDSFEASSGCMYFCSGDCEDKFAWFEESIKPTHKIREAADE